MKNKQVLEELIDLSREKKTLVTPIVIEYTQVYNMATDVLNLSVESARIYSLNYVKQSYRNYSD